MGSAKESTSESSIQGQKQNPSNLVEKPFVNSSDPTQSQTVQCPICLENFNVQEIQQHVEECSTWLLNQDDDVEVKHSDSQQTIAKKDDQMKISDMGKNEIKKMLKEEVAQVSGLDIQHASPKRVTVRRKNIWEDFKDEIFQRNRISPSDKIKVVFSGEPAVDDGGPRRELFSGTWSISS